MLLGIPAIVMRAISNSTEENLIVRYHMLVLRVIQALKRLKLTIYWYARVVS